MHSLFPRLSAVLGMALVAGLLLVPLDAAAKPKKHNHDEASIVLKGRQRERSGTGRRHICRRT